jgi:hypothetical protein
VRRDADYPEVAISGGAMTKVRTSAQRKSSLACATISSRTSVADRRATFVVNGRVASKSLADPDMEDAVNAAVKRMLSDKEAARQYLLKRGAKVQSKARPKEQASA